MNSSRKLVGSALAVAAVVAGAFALWHVTAPARGQALAIAGVLGIPTGTIVREWSEEVALSSGRIASVRRVGKTQRSGGAVSRHGPDVGFSMQNLPLSGSWEGGERPVAFDIVDGSPYIALERRGWRCGDTDAFLFLRWTGVWEPVGESQRLSALLRVNLLRNIRIPEATEGSVTLRTKQVKDHGHGQLLEDVLVERERHCEMNRR